MRDRFRFFNAVVPPVVTFASGHRVVHAKDLAQLDIGFRKVMRSAVGPRSDIDWCVALHSSVGVWHCIPHGWNMLEPKNGKH